MKPTLILTLLIGLLLVVLTTVSAFGATTIISDNYNANSGTTRGFLLGEGVNFNINPPATTRLTGSAVGGLRYLYTQETTDKKATTQYRITSSKVQVAGSSYSGRFSLSADGTSPFDFSGALGTLTATRANPVVYDVRISMANTLVGIQKISFGLGTVEGNVTLWDFGIQLYRANVADLVYRVDERIDTGSTGITDRTVTYNTTETFGNELAFRMRVTDAGAESGAAYNSRVQLFMGDTEIYDTQDDAALINGWRLDGPDRYFIWDQAGASGVSGYVTYDNFSAVLFPETVWNGGGADDNWGNTGNWVGTIPPCDGDSLVFTGTTRQANNNNLGASTLTLVPSVTFNNGGFTLSGNPLTVTRAITNVAGANTMNNALTLNNETSINTGSGVLTLGGNLTGAGSVAKSGLGTLVLSGANTYSGNTVVSQGTLVISGSIGSGAVTVQDTATLGGAGVIGGAVTVQNGGVLAPGAGIGTLTLGTSPTLGGTLAMEINKDTSSADKLDLSAGTFTYAGTLGLSVTGSLVGGEEYDLFDFSGTSTSAFDAISTTPALATGLNWWQGKLAAEGKLVLNRAPAGVVDRGLSRSKGTSIKIKKADLMAGVSDADDGDSASLDGLVSMTSNQGVTVTEDSTSYYYEPINDNSDYLQYKVRDTRGGTVTKNINITVTDAFAPGQQIAVVGGKANLTFAGIPGLRYDVQRATDVNFTENVATVLSTNAPATGLFLLVDEPGLDQAYYRLKYPGTPAP